MKSLKNLLLAVLALAFAAVVARAENVKPESLPAGRNMYVIERDMPGLGKLTPAELKAASQKSCAVLRGLDGKVTWLHSYVTGDKMFCVYLAPNEDLVREHARQGGFPANSVVRVSTIIGPETATK
jgi:hypothetical protein